MPSRSLRRIERGRELARLCFALAVGFTVTPLGTGSAFAQQAPSGEDFFGEDSSGGDAFPESGGLLGGGLPGDAPRTRAAGFSQLPQSIGRELLLRKRRRPKSSSGWGAFTKSVRRAFVRRDLQAGLSVLAGVPHPLDASFDLMIGKRFSAGLAGGYIRLNSSRLLLDFANLEAKARWHPFGGAFFLGAAFGTNTIDGTAITTVTTRILFWDVDTDITAHFKLNGLYVTPQIGWMWILRSGLMLGIDLGWQFPIDQNIHVDVSGDGFFGAILDVAKFFGALDGLDATVNKFGGYGSPYVTVLRVGWMF